MEDYKKKYEQALERAKKYYNRELYAECNGSLVEDIFPELKESEDERIRKALIHYFSEQDGILTAINGSVSVGDILAWLEKQSKKVDAIENFDTEFEKQVSHLIASIINKEHEYNEGFVKWTANVLLNYAKHELEKQGEQKPTDKVEPKFEIEKGKWYVCNTPRYRDFVVGKAYYCPKNGMLKPNENEMARYVARHCFHLWTIQDARDGDVLATKDAVFIFKHMDKTGLSLCKSYCEVIGNSKLGLGFDFSINDIHLATKEQRDLLFQKMKEAGYEWDADKKELKKIEHKTTIGIDNSFDNIKFPFKAKVKSTDAIVIIHDGQLSDDGKEWIKYQSNKDDGYRVYRPEDLEFICNLKEQIDTINTTFKLNDCILDENGFAIQSEQKPAWSEEDEKMWATVSDLLWEGYKLSDKKVSWYNIRYWLLPKIICLKDRVQPQPKQEWSEEDEKHLLGCINYFTGITEYSPYYKDFLWLKSLRERMKGE